MGRNILTPCVFCQGASYNDNFKVIGKRMFHNDYGSDNIYVDDIQDMLGGAFVCIKCSTSILQSFEIEKDIEYIKYLNGKIEDCKKLLNINFDDDDWKEEGSVFTILNVNYDFQSADGTYDLIIKKIREVHSEIKKTKNENKDLIFENIEKVLLHTLEKESIVYSARKKGKFSLSQISALLNITPYSAKKRFNNTESLDFWKVIKEWNRGI